MNFKDLMKNSLNEGNKTTYEMAIDSANISEKNINTLMNEIGSINSNIYTLKDLFHKKNPVTDKRTKLFNNVIQKTISIKSTLKDMLVDIKELKMDITTLESSMKRD